MYQRYTPSGSSRARHPIRPRSAAAVALARQQRVPLWYLWLRRLAERLGADR